MAFKIEPFPGQTYGGAYADHHDIRAYLGFGQLVEHKTGHGTLTVLESKRLPIDFCESGVWVPLLGGGSTMITCEPGRPVNEYRKHKSSKHRCHAKCPDCGAWVPTGRTHQHKCKPTAE